MAIDRSVANALAQQRLLAKSRTYDNVAYLRKSDGSVRHKCFLSYHHEDALEVEEFVNAYESVFIPKVVGVSDYGDIINSDDDDYVMDTIREKYLTDSTVTIVFIGKCTHTRKFIDWEVLSSLRNDPKNRRNGLLSVQLKSVPGGAVLPSRVNLNTGSEGSNKYARYWAYPSTASGVQTIIQDAFDARASRSKWISLGGAKQANNKNCT